MYDEHRHGRAIFGFIPHLLGFKLFRIEIHFWSHEQRAFASGHVITINRGGVGEGGKRVERLCGVCFSTKSTRAACGIGQVDFAGVLSVEVHAHHRVAGIAQVGGK